MTRVGATSSASSAPALRVPVSCRGSISRKRGRAEGQFVRRFELAVPDTLDACLAVLAERGAEAKPVAGGTDLIPQAKNGLIRPAWVVDLSGLPELRVLEAGPEGLRVGAAVSARTLELDPAVRASYPVLADGAALVGSIQVRNL